MENEGEFIMNFHGKDIKIFTANSNPMVAKRIAECLGLPLGKSEVGTFSDGEIAVSLFESVRGSDCFIVQSTCSPVNNNIMELLIMIDAMKRASAARITAVIPYFGYARQDRKAKARDPISAKLVADLITTAGADRVLTMDLHAPQIQGFFNIPVDHLVGAPTLASFLRGRIGRDNEEYVVVSPDLGSVTRARNFASRLGCPLAIIDKRRQRANVCEVMNIIGDVKGKKVILVDDMIDTAGTLCNGAAAIIEKGGALEVTAAATHGVLSGPAIERIADSPIKELILLDTVPVTGERKLDKMTILSVAPLFAEAIERIYEDKPVSPRGRIGRDNEEYVVVSPDLGSVTRARNFASRLGCPLAIIDKRRQRANVCEVMNIIGDVKGKKVILVDDMIDTAGTLCNGAAAIIEKGGALEVTAAATHGVLSGPAIERIADSPIKELILLDTVPVTGERKLDKMTILSVAPLFAEAIERIYEDKPVSPMFL